jgi:hypothetical protein
MWFARNCASNLVVATKAVAGYQGDILALASFQPVSQPHHNRALGRKVAETLGEITTIGEPQPLP